MLGRTGPAETVRVGRVDKGDLDAQPGEGVIELVVGPAVQGAGRDDVIAGGAQGQDGLDLRRVTRTGRQRAHAAFQVGKALFEHIGGGVHQPGIDVAGFLQREKSRAA